MSAGNPVTAVDLVLLLNQGGQVRHLAAADPVQPVVVTAAPVAARSTGLPHFPHVGGFASWSARSWSRTAARTWPSVRSLAGHLVLPEADEKALAGLKFLRRAAEHLAVATLARCLADLENASYVLAEPVRFERWAGGSMGRRR